MVRGEPVGGGAGRGCEGVKLVEERKRAAGPKEVGKEAGFRPEALTEAVVQSILEAASRAEADDLLLGTWWSGAELLQSWPGHAIVRKPAMVAGAAAASVESWGGVFGDGATRIKPWIQPFGGGTGTAARGGGKQ